MEQIVQLNANAKLSEHLASPSEAALGHSNKLDGSHLSPNFTLGEMTRSNSHPDIYNIPSHEAITNLTNLCKWLEVLRLRAGTPIRINSGYRSPQLNKAIHGVAGSNHMTGCAADIRVENVEQLIRYAAILLDYAKESKQEFDELLIEKNRYGAIWLHFAVRPKDNRRKVAFINA
ncbi:MAG: DUF882 domain-containing protein [Prevotella ruminicola]|jgi:hypothetical protein|uniref:DUF882 domain-containing protein n=1 Tax=Xylanibacter ruminicola TaxID=839 RepID=A0A928BSK9_XYLRU|nr:DUF882 domain-containing protein [Xylanibacter ruminicola]